LNDETVPPSDGKRRLAGIVQQPGPQAIAWPTS
jgi:hypothetical protein